MSDPYYNYDQPITHLKIFFEDDGWAVDGRCADPDLYTEEVWKFDTFEEVVANLPDFVERLKESGHTFEWRKRS